MTERIDTTDTERTIAHHVSGDEYIVEVASVWEGETCVGTRIIGCAGPVDRHGPGMAEFNAHPRRWTPTLRQAIRENPALSSEDADWLQVEEDAGKVTYPFGGWA